MYRHPLALLVPLFVLGCGGSGQHRQDSQAQNEHHGQGHSGEHKDAHGEGMHKHAHGGDHDQSKHQHGADHEEGEHHHGGDHDQSKHQHGAQPLGHRFQNAEEWAKRFDDPKRSEWQMPTQVVELMEIAPGMRVADIGAGTGYFLPYLAAKTGAKGAVLGLDIEEDMVRYMGERAEREKLVGVSARVVATDDPGFAPASMDRILIVDTWHHLPERVAYAKKLAAGLKPGGTVTIVDFTMETKRGPAKKHRLSAESIIAELEAAGLAAELLTETLPDQYLVRGTKSK